MMKKGRGGGKEHAAPTHFIEVQNLDVLLKIQTDAIAAVWC